MRCPKCAAIDDKVIDSRLSKDGASIRRRRECIDCGHRFTTYEVVERADLRVVKRDGRTEPFDRQKISGGILKACEKRPVRLEEIEHAVEAILQEIETHYDREVPTQVIGAKVMQQIHALDEVAYVRYASVYRHFQDIGEFISEIQALERREKPSVSQPDLFVASKS